MIPCALIFTPVMADTEEACAFAQTFADEYALVSDAHRALVRKILVVHWSHSNSDHHGRIRLRMGARPGELLHEVGHQISYTNGLQEAWDARFWQDGTYVGMTVSIYGKTNSHEDFAEAYRATVQRRQVRRQQLSRICWMRQHVTSPDVS